MMPVTRIDTVDAVELAEILQLITGWLAADRAALAPSFLAYIGRPAYGLDALRDDLARFRFLLGVTDGEGLFTPDEP